MKITGFRQLHGDFGWRTQSFLKIETSDGTVGWTEYYEGAGNLGLNALLAAHLERLVGEDPLQVESILVRLQGKRPEVDIPFTYTGLRPGEKMHEELVGEGEDSSPTKLEGVRIVHVPPAGGQAELHRLLAVARNGAMEEGWGIHLVQHLVGAGASEPAGRS